MRTSRLRWFFGTFFIILLLVLSYVYFKDARALEKIKFENALMSQKIEESILKQKEAIVQKRISEQLEEIALQQKLITESQKTIAFKQRTIAEQKQREAIMQRQIADKAKATAVNAFKDAEEQRKIAIGQKNAAEAAEKNANRLRMLALGQSLSARSINQKNTGNDTLATMLALAAWQFTNENKGDLYQSELFQALKISVEEENSLRAHKGFIRDIDAIRKGDQINLVSVSQNGEIILWENSAWTFQPRILMENPEYDLRSVSFNHSGTAFASSDASGNVIIADAPYQSSNFDIIELSDTKIKSIAFINDDLLIYPEGSNLMELNIGLNRVSIEHKQIYKHADDIEFLLFDQKSGKVFFSDVTGNVFSFVPASNQIYLHFRHNMRNISCIAVGEKEKIAIGTTSGKIYVEDHHNKNDVKEFVGHISQVNDLVFSKDLLISISYDRTVRLWDLENFSFEPVVIEEHDDWGYSVNVIPGAEKVISAGADKRIRVTTIDPKELAELVQEKFPREFTNDEWEAYVGSAVDYKSLKKK